MIKLEIAYYEIPDGETYDFYNSVTELLKVVIEVEEEYEEDHNYIASRCPKVDDWSSVELVTIGRI